MLNRPIGGLFCGSDGDTAKSVLFELMAGFCAHGLPFCYDGGLGVLWQTSSLSGPKQQRQKRLVGAERGFESNGLLTAPESISVSDSDRLMN